VVVVAAKVNAKLAARAKAQRVHHATVQHLRAAMARQARHVLMARAPPDLKAKGMVAVKVDARVAVVKSNAATRVSTTAVMAKAVPHHVAPVPKAVAQVVARKVGKAAMGVKTATAATVTSCHATSTP
jgi:hypothetical protein